MSEMSVDSVLEQIEDAWREEADLGVAARLRREHPDYAPDIDAFVAAMVEPAPSVYGLWSDASGWLRADSGNQFQTDRLDVAEQALARLTADGAVGVEVRSTNQHP